MIHSARAVLLLLASAIALSACVVETPAPRYVRGPGCRWIPEHYGAEGRFHPGHCA